MVRQAQTNTIGPKVLLLVSSSCSHCHTMQSLLQNRKTSGVISDLSVVNVERSPELAEQYQVRSVPWTQIGPFIFDVTLSATELDRWIAIATSGGGRADYLQFLLEHGRLDTAISWIENGNATLKDIILLLENTDAKMQVKVGIGAILEHFEATSEIKAILNDLIPLLETDNVTLRTDVCHYLSLTHMKEAITPLQRMLEDKNPQVREVALESLEALMDSSASSPQHSKSNLH